MESKERDLVLPANEYALILDQTKGHISVYTGPTKQSLSQTDQPVYYKSGRFHRCELSSSVQPFCLARQGDYIELENPVTKGDEHPAPGASSTPPHLQAGKKVNLPGPVSFALWPGQTAKVIGGHTLTSNQYLLVRVYDDKSAKEQIGSAIIETKASETQSQPGSQQSDQQTTSRKEELIKADQLSMGKLIVIKGTDVNFFIPPTGLEVVPDEEGNYVRDAVSLERLEYCLLLDQNGNKRYVRGPDVVFPKPTEEFVSEDGVRKFRAIELNPNSGIHIKIIADYKEKDKTFATGDELFITGRDQKIYFPREEHAIVRSNGEQIHHGVTLPRGEARYVLDKEKGIINTVKGPCIFLPDPRKQIIVKRILTDSQCQLMYPGNTEALQYNKGLASQLRSQQKAVEEVKNYARNRRASSRKSADSRNITASLNRDATKGLELDSANYLTTTSSLVGAPMGAPAAASFDAGTVVVGDIFDAALDYHQPQSITIDNKYDGAVSVSPWTGYAVMVKNKEGKREIVMGPNTRVLEYDEELDVLALSTGRPKNDKSLKKTVYLQVENNRVSDIIDVETNDFTKAQVTVSFRVNFVGDSQKWFNVANYTKLLSEHMRSRIRRAAMQYDVEKFYRNAADIIRDTVLGTSAATTEGKAKKRPGFTFEENDMHIYDVEVLDVLLKDNSIQQMLLNVQREGINHALERNRLAREVEHTKIVELARREQSETLAQTDILRQEINKRAILVAREVNEVKFKTDQASGNEKLELAQLENQIHSTELERELAASQQKLIISNKEQEIKISLIKAETDATTEKAKAFTPHLIAALQNFGDSVTLERFAAAVSPFGIIDMIRGQSVVETLRRLTRGSNFDVSFVKNNELPPGKKTGTE